MTIKISKEFQIGLALVACIAILFFGVNYLKGINMFNPTNYYYAKYSNIDGLVQSSEVLSHGHKVGLVKEIIYNYDDPDADVVAVLEVDNDLKIPKGARAVLQTSLMGSASIFLEMKGCSMADIHQKGDTLPTSIPAGMMASITDGLMPKLEEIIPHIDQLIVNLNTVVSDPNIAKSLKNLNVMSSELAATSTQLKKMVGNDLPPILADAKQITGNFTTFSGNLNQLDLNGTLKRVDNTMDGLNVTIGKINNGNGSIGLLLNDRKLYDNLNATASDADKLMIDLKKNPGRYVHFSVFEKKEKKKKSDTEEE